MKRFLYIIFLSLTLLLGVSVSAQNRPIELRIIRINTEQLPTVELTVLSRDGDGNPAPLDGELVSVRHNDELVNNAQVVGLESIGTFTVFLLDLPPGVGDKIETMKETITEFTSPSFMQEQTDYVSIYRVDEIAALEMQPPTFFYNDILNLFTLGIETQSGPTALIDSLGDILSRIDTLKPNPAQTASIVVFSDGTDAISTQYSAQEIKNLAAQKGVRIYTVVVENPNLFTDNGRLFMEELAADTNGGSVLLTDRTGTKILYDEIAAFRELPIIRYQPTNLVAGSASVIVSLPDFPDVPPVSTTIEVPPSIPSVQINVSEEATSLSLPDLVEPVSLVIPASVSWLDGEMRTVEQAQLWLDGRVLQEIDLETTELAAISADIPLTFGENRIQVVIIDDAGQAGQSAPLILNVEQGDRSIPSEISAGLDIPWQIIGYVLVCLFILTLMLVFFNMLRKGRFAGVSEAVSSRRERAAAARRRKQVESQTASSKAASGESPQHSQQSSYAPVTGRGYADQMTMPSANGMPTIEVLDARSSTPSLVPINRSEFLIGRSPTVDLALTEDSTVSRIHATIVQDGGIFRIYDEQSTSGTFVNDREVPEYGLQLGPGDEIHIGAVHLRFRQ